MTVLRPHKPAEPSLTRMSDGIVSLRASDNKLARAQAAPLSNLKTLSDEVRLLSGAIKAMRADADEDEARRHLH